MQRAPRSVQLTFCHTKRQVKHQHPNNPHSHTQANPAQTLPPPPQLTSHSMHWSWTKPVARPEGRRGRISAWRAPANGMETERSQRNRTLNCLFFFKMALGFNTVTQCHWGSPVHSGENQPSVSSRGGGASTSGAGTGAGAPEVPGTGGGGGGGRPCPTLRSPFPLA